MSNIEIKKEFQLERVVLFSDALFAIIITIMVIDIKLPETARYADKVEVLIAFKALLPRLIAYGIAFFLVAAFWLRHLRIFSFLKDYDGALLVYNLFFLFTISFFPFAVSLISGSVEMSMVFYCWAVNTYIGIVFSATFMQSIITWHVVSNQKKLCIEHQEIEIDLQWKVQRTYFILLPLLVLLLFFMNRIAASPFYNMLPLIVFGMVTGMLKRHYYAGTESLKNRIKFFIRQLTKVSRSLFKAKSVKGK